MLQQKMEQKISCVWTFWLLNVHTYIHIYIYNIYIYMYMDVTIAEQNVCMHNYTCITSRHLVLRDLCNDAQVPYLSSSGMPE